MQQDVLEVLDAKFTRHPALQSNILFERLLCDCHDKSTREHGAGPLRRVILRSLNLFTIPQEPSYCTSP